ncbi:hypothetical protein IQ254_12655 [Nodosilinea sp. LEGE 07088]|uniref:hypothetical protein n=1 Tax=Nodosilinea sp. LEGE 07088 TaxID=2777968 RepID=UPI001880EB10|nr:hypothetical protein [Nodosilinea sp. LEGE 07088]MBE9138029.1 hypothetical protein [Nodosilinea sp. LEGE 07088]
MNLVSNPLGRIASQCIRRSRQILSRPGNQLAHIKYRGISGWTLLGLVTGILLFISITTHANPAMAQLFDTVEGQAQNIFGQYLDGDIISFMFGLLRLVVWVSAVGFVFFAVYQAQRGEQWQPLLQNAFIIIAAVVIVEGLSRLFFGA